MAKLSGHVLARRMNPGDVRECLESSDIFPLIRARGIADQLEALLSELMLRGRLWGSVVLSASTRKILCHGSCIFLHRDLGEEVLAGQHPFLLADLVTDHRLQSLVLELDEVERDSQLGDLYFYGALFTFPSFRNPSQATDALRELHSDCVLQMSGFNIKWHMKPTYGVSILRDKLTSLALRKQFGTDLRHTYGDLESKDPEVKQFRPALFAVDRETASQRVASLVNQIIGEHRYPELNLSPKMRNILRLELEFMRDHDIVKHLSNSGKGYDGFIREALERLKSTIDLPGDLLEELEANLEINEELRAALARIVSHNPHELGVLPLLTKAETQFWREQIRSRGKGSGSA